MMVLPGKAMAQTQIAITGVDAVVPAELAPVFGATPVLTPFSTDKFNVTILQWYDQGTPFLLGEVFKPGHIYNVDVKFEAKPNHYFSVPVGGAANFFTINKPESN
jgi:hypothetical protein